MSVCFCTLPVHTYLFIPTKFFYLMIKSKGIKYGPSKMIVCLSHTHCIYWSVLLYISRCKHARSYIWMQACKIILNNFLASIISSWFGKAFWCNFETKPLSAYVHRMSISACTAASFRRISSSISHASYSTYIQPGLQMRGICDMHTRNPILQIHLE